MWVKNQRRTGLNAFQVAVLEALPGWSWVPPEKRFEARAEQVRVFVHEHRRLPRIRSHDTSERAVAQWLTRQRRAVARGELSVERARVVAYVLRVLGDV